MVANVKEKYGLDVSQLDFVSVSEDEDAVLGNPDAPVTIVEFSDFQCPYCAKFVEDTKDLLVEEYVSKGLVKFIYRDFPLPSHTEAALAAEATECVGEYGGDKLYYDMHDAVFMRTEEWSQVENAEEVFVGMAGELGVDIAACLADGEMAAEVEADYTAGRSYGVTGTPTFFINGKKVVGALPFEVFEAIIESEL